MKFTFAHNNLNVKNLEESLQFYQQALGLVETRRVEQEAFTLVFLGDKTTPHALELTWLREHESPYDLGENEFHLAFETDDFDAALEKHREMGCVCFENPAMGIYFIADPDGYWLEIIPKSREPKESGGLRQAKIEVCMCTQCVMNGAMDIVESVEGLKKLIPQLGLHIQPKIVTNACLGSPKHGERSPVVSIDGKLVERAQPEIVMSMVLALGKDQEEDA